MAKTIGSLVNVGIGRETTRGTAVTPAYWLPKAEFDFQDKAERIGYSAPYGVIEDEMDGDIGKLWGEGTLTMPVRDKSLGLIMSAVLGEIPATALTETGVWTHTYAGFEQSSLHQSLTIRRQDANEALSFPNAMIQSYELQYVLGEFVSQSIGFMSKAGASASSASTYVAENYFRPQDLTFKFAVNQAGLAAASAIVVDELTLTIEKNLIDYQALGSTALNEIFNGQVAVSGSVTLLWDATTYKALYTAQTVQAVRMTLENTKTLIGATKYPKLEIDLYRAQVEEWELEQSNDGIIKQTLGFKGMYSLADSKSIQVTIQNAVATY